MGTELNLPGVAIVIPCRNEEAYIGKCLQSILDQDYAGIVKAYVCDGLSDDGTRNIVSGFSNNYSQIILLDNEKRTTPFALNLGIRNSKEDIVIILGAHAELYPDYVRLCVERLQSDASLGCAGGIIENIYENDAARVISKAMSSPFGVGSAHFRTGLKSGYVDTVAFGAYTKAVFERAGLFDEELVRNQDDEFNFRILKNGFKIFLDPKIRSKYYVRGSYEKLYKQYYQYGYWKVYVNRKHKTITTMRQLFPALFVLFLIPGLLLSLLHVYLMILWLVVLLTYLTGGIFFASKVSGKDTGVLSVLKVFMILHFSYGSGYLKGILDFFIRGKQPAKKQHELTR